MPLIWWLKTNVYAPPVIQLAVSEQSRIGGDRRTAKLEHQPAVEIEPQRASIRFTRRVRHRRPG